jgi:cytochrome c556
VTRGAALAVVFAVAAASAGLAAHPVDDAMVAARQHSMKDMAEAARTIDWMFAGRRPYEAQAFKEAAETIRRHSGDALVTEFPPGSHEGESAATAEIDRSREEFAALANHLEQFAAALSDAADEAPNGITDEMRMAHGMAMGGSLLGRRSGMGANVDPSTIPAEHVFHLMLQDCASCHAKFRERVQ